MTTKITLIRVDNDEVERDEDEIDDKTQIILQFKVSQRGVYGKIDINCERKNCEFCTIKRNSCDFTIHTFGINMLFPIAQSIFIQMEFSFLEP